MATNLRELLLAIKIKVDKAAVKETDVAFDHATQSAQGFESRLSGITSGLQKVASKLRVNTELAKKFRAAVIGASGLRPEAPSQKAARERRAAEADALGLRSAAHPAPPRPGQPSMAAPDIAAFTDNRTGPRKALDAFKAKASSVFTSAGAAAERFTGKFDKVADAIFNARTAVAAFAITMAGAAVGRFLGSIIEAGGALHDMAQRTRVSVETLQVWKAIAADAGVDAGAIEGAFRKLNKSMAAAARGSKLQAQSFKELGVELKNGDQLRPIEDVLIDTGAALAQMDDDAKATAIAVQLLGPAGAGLVPAFNNGAEAVRKLSAEMKENVALNAEEAARLDDVGDALTRGSKKWTAMKMRLGVALLPVLELVANGFEKLSKWLLRMTKETQGLLMVLGGVGLAGLVRFVAGMLSFASKTQQGQMALKTFGGSLRSAAGFAFRFLMPLLLIEDFLTFLAGGKSVFGRAFEEIFGPGGAKSVREGILAALTAVGTYINETLLPAVRGLVDNDLFRGVAKTALDGILSVLNLIGFALADNAEKAQKMADAFQKNGGGPSAQERDQAIKEGLPENRKPLTEGQGLVRRVVTGFLGDPLNDPVVKANADANAKREEQRRLALDGVVASPAAPPQPGGSSKVVTLNDQRKIEVNVGPGTQPGAMGRAVGGAVQGALQVDQRQVLQSVGG